MPEVSRFYGIVIRVFYNDHHPPHFHAEYSAEQMAVTIETLGVMAGRLPPRATAMVLEWGAAHQGDLQRAWNQARQMQPIDRIEPLP